MKDELLALPQDDDTWIAGAHPLPIPAKDSGPPQTVWLILVQSRTRFFVLGSRTSTSEPSAQELLSTLVETMFEPKEGTPARPRAVETGPNLPWQPVIPLLEQIGITTHEPTDLSNLNTAFQHLAIELTGQLLPNLPIGPK
jgi:hypothetical protein